MSACGRCESSKLLHESTMRRCIHSSGKNADSSGRKWRRLLGRSDEQVHWVVGVRKRSCLFAFRGREFARSFEMNNEVVRSQNDSKMHWKGNEVTLRNYPSCEEFWWNFSHCTSKQMNWWDSSIVVCAKTQGQSDDTEMWTEKCSAEWNLSSQRDIAAWVPQMLSIFQDKVSPLVQYSAW